MATIHPPAPSFSQPTALHQAPHQDFDFFAQFADSAPLPPLDLSRAVPEPSFQQPLAMEALRPIFDSSALDQLLADAPNFFPDIDIPEELSYAPDTFVSSGSSPRDDLSHSSGDHEASRKATSSLAITEEERSMLAESGVIIPADAITLTKAEDKALKSVRRRLRNKLSAQDSRKKKKEYVDGLEQRVASCTAVNIEMQGRVTNLAQENRTLRQQLQQLKEMVARMGGPQAATTGTILMVLALSFSMFVNPLSSSVPANVTDLPSAGSRTLKALPSTTPPMATLRDVLSSWLFDRRQEEDAPSLAPLAKQIRAGAP